MDVDQLAQIIRTVDGENKLGAGALAEAILGAIGVSRSIGPLLTLNAVNIVHADLLKEIEDNPLMDGSECWAIDEMHSRLIAAMAPTGD